MKTKITIPPKKIGARVRLFTFGNRDREKFLAGEKCFPLRATGWIDNLVLDQGLNLIAGGIGYGGSFTRLSVGSGNSPNEFNAAGSAVFTQVGTTLTCSAAIFTSAMVGAIFKYGATGVGTGAEQYIAAFTNSTTVTVSGAGMTVSTPTAGAVWMVQQTALQTPISGGTSTTYVSGSNSATFTGTTATLLRTFQFAAPSATWSVNEVGYDGTGSLIGRIVLPSTVTVTTSEFLVAQCELVVTQNPNTPTAVANIGTGFNTAGTAMQQVWDIRSVNSAGATTPVNQTVHAGGSNKACTADGIPAGIFFVTGSVITQNSSILNSNQVDISQSIYASFTSNGISNSGHPVGVGVMTSQSFSTTTAGETCYSIAFGSGGGVTASCGYVINLTTPVALPSGIFSGSWFMQWTFARQLVN